MSGAVLVVEPVTVGGRAVGGVRLSFPSAAAPAAEP
jgi:hypothetical protein